MAARMAWHCSGTFDRHSNTGGSNGATMRFEPENSDGANAGLGIVHDLLLPVKRNHPDLSWADLYIVAGCVGIEFIGGPAIPVNLGRSDDVDGTRCPANGRLPDASQGAAHLRALFGERMGFSDRDIVALSGAHTIGAAHTVRSGYNGAWTTNSFKWDNEYFRNLLLLEWVATPSPAGKTQYVDAPTRKLMMLSTDLALKTDPEFRKYVELYADNQQAFNADFASAYSRLIALGCPAQCQPDFVPAPPTEVENIGATFRHLAMFGSIDDARLLVDKCDVHGVESYSGRSALHKSAFWGHTDMARYLIDELKLNIHVQDVAGDTPLHDAAKFGHAAIVTMLLAAGADARARNHAGQTPIDLATAHEKAAVLALLNGSAHSAAKL